MLTSKLSDYIISTSFDQLPENVLNKAKDCFMDFLGVAIKGSTTRGSESVRGVIKPGDESTVIGDFKASALDAGMANGISAHSLDLDDGHQLAQLHPGACVIPAALALCESRKRSGRELIESMVAGYQTAIALGILINPTHREQGFHSTGTCGTLGAAAAACKALKLNKTQIIDALGLAGTQAAGLLESDHSGSMGKHLHAGRAVQSGILSALLAENGFTGAPTILEGDEGFFKAMSGVDPSKTDFNLIFNDYKILEVYFKIYPVCRHLHSSIDALLAIFKDNHIKPDEIKEIVVYTYKIAASHDNYHPTNTEALRQSLPLSLAVSLLNENNRMNNLYNMNYPSNDKIFNHKVSELSRKIVIKEDVNLTKKYPSTRPSHVFVRTLDENFEQRVDLPFGEPENPLKKSDIKQKFINLNPKVDTKVFHIIENMENYQDINQFMDEINQQITV